SRRQRRDGFEFDASGTDLTGLDRVGRAVDRIGRKDVVLGQIEGRSREGRVPALRLEFDAALEGLACRWREWLRPAARCGYTRLRQERGRVVDIWRQSEIEQIQKSRAAREFARIAARDLAEIGSRQAVLAAEVREVLSAAKR